MFFAYILYNKEINKYYIGHTQDIEKRLIDHNKKGHKVKFTKKQTGKWEIVYTQEFQTRSEAMKREKEIKSKKSREYTNNLVAQWIEQSRSKSG